MKSIKILENGSDKNNNLMVDLEFRQRMNADLDYCGLDNDIQKGFLFFMGAAMNSVVNDTPIDVSDFLVDEEEIQDSMLRILNQYSLSTGDFIDYGQLNDYVLYKHIYMYHHILYKLIF